MKSATHLLTLALLPALLAWPCFAQAPADVPAPTMDATFSQDAPLPDVPPADSPPAESHDGHAHVKPAEMKEAAPVPTIIFDEPTLTFLREIDADALSRLPLQYKGRVAPLDTLARDALSQMYGQTTIDDIPPAAAYMELFLRSGAYLGKPILYVREKYMRGYLLKDAAAELGPAKYAFEKTHRLPPMMLINRMGLELFLRTGRASLDQIHTAGQLPSLGGVMADLADKGEFRVPIDRLSMRLSDFLAYDTMKIFPVDRDWLSLDAICPTPQASQTDHSTLPLNLDTKFKKFRDAWLERDAKEANRLLATFRQAQASLDVREQIPSETAVTLELLYNRTYRFTIAWIGFAVAMLLLILAAATGKRWPRQVGLALLGVSTIVLGVGIGIRWMLSGREWYLPPIMNQFEAVMGSALLAAAGGFLIELLWKRNYVGLAGALYATVSLLACFFLPGRMGATISAPAGILNSPVMAAHVALIIVGHAFVGMGAVISLIYLAALPFRYRSKDGTTPARSAPADLVGTCPETPLAVIDRCNLLIAQLACWTVAVGTLLGAYWADFAWGRWWGWDNKEVWALITCLILFAVLHIRFVIPTKHRGLWTAAGCLLAGAAMLFNWIVVNYFMAGLHSYS